MQLGFNFRSATSYIADYTIIGNYGFFCLLSLHFLQNFLFKRFDYASIFSKRFLKSCQIKRIWRFKKKKLRKIYQISSRRHQDTSEKSLKVIKSPRKDNLTP